jgi:hypothetical protein
VKGGRKKERKNVFDRKAKQQKQRREGFVFLFLSFFLPPSPPFILFFLSFFLSFSFQVSFRSRNSEMRICEEFLYIIVNNLPKETLNQLQVSSIPTSRGTTTSHTPRPGSVRSPVSPRGVAVPSIVVPPTKNPPQNPLALSIPIDPKDPLQTMQPFEFLYSEKGFSNVKKWFTNSANSNRIYNENQFITFLRELLKDFGDAEILEIFDTFGKLGL